MKIAVVTPYYAEPDSVLNRARESVRDQRRPATHILVADGRPNPVFSSSAEHITLANHADHGATPRALGAFSAFSRGFDAVAFLDADCWYEPEHLESCAEAMAGRRVDFVTASRYLRRPDGSLLGTDLHDSDGDRHCDTNCMFMSRRAMEILHTWFADRSLKSVSDSKFWVEVKRKGVSRTHLTTPTVNYTTLWAAHYLSRGLTPPDDAKVIVADADGGLSIRPYRAEVSLPFGDKARAVTS